MSSEPYASRFAAFRAAIGASGIRTLRDELRPDNDLARWRGLYVDFAIRSHLLVSPVTNTVSEMLTYLDAIGVEKVSAIEGQNEGDTDWFKAQPQANADWAGAVVAYQRLVFAAVRGRYSAAILPVVSPSIIDWKPEDVRLIRAAAAYSDVVAIHPYPQHAQEPETGDDYAALGWYLRMMRDPFKPAAPVMATETGYCTVAQRGSAGVSEAAVARYIPRMLLTNFAAGVTRTFLYEFMDGGTDRSECEDNYGLVRNDGQAKPAYAAVRTLLQALRDSGPAFAPGLLAVVIPGAPATARSLLLQKRDGSFYLVLWLAERSWDPVRGTDVAVPPRPLRVVVTPRFTRAASLVPTEGPSWTALPIAAEGISLPISDTVTILRLQP